MTSKERKIEHEQGGHVRALAVVERGENFRIVGPIPKGAQHRTIWKRNYHNLKLVPLADLTRAVDGFKHNVHFRRRVGELAEVFVATSGVIAVLTIVLGMTVMIRAIRSLHRR